MKFTIKFDSPVGEEKKKYLKFRPFVKIFCGGGDFFGAHNGYQGCKVKKKTPNIEKFPKIETPKTPRQNQMKFNLK